MQPNHIKNEIVYIKQTLREQDKPKPLNISHCIWNPGSRYSNAKHISKERNIDILLSFITTKTCLHCFFVRTKHSAPSMLNHQENTRKKKQKKIFLQFIYHAKSDYRKKLQNYIL
uniref:(northern house mosquito) hypothetical protein n=1 Tax=Culex pipiens TaxID=7175 RepID=A0A8D8JPE1_CULPI